MKMVSFILIFYNQRSYVQRAVAQRYTNLDSVVVDDGSDEPLMIRVEPLRMTASFF